MFSWGNAGIGLEDLETEWPGEPGQEHEGPGRMASKLLEMFYSAIKKET